MLEIVAIAVVEGETHEAPAEIALGHAAVHLVEADDVDARAAQELDHAGEEARRDFQEPIGLEAIGPRRAHMMQRQDRADPADQRLQRDMGAAEIQRLQAAADDGLLQASHDSCCRCSLRFPLSFSTLS